MQCNEDNDVADHINDRQDGVVDGALSDHSEEADADRQEQGPSPEGTPCILCRRTLQPVEQRLRHLPERPLCNACCFRDMDPFKPVRELEHVMYMSVLPGRHLTFDLEVADLRQWRKDGFEVELRGLRRRAVSESQGLHQVWPSFLSVEVNGHEVFTTKVPLRGHKRRDVPQSLSANLRRGANTVEITAEDERRRDYMLAVVRTFPLRPKDLAPLVPEDGYQECLQRVQVLLHESIAQGQTHHGIDGVERVGDEHLKLQCPLTLMRPSSPVRGAECRHFQCLDLDPYLISNYRMKAFNSRWRCPLCSLDLRPKDLRVDTFVQMLLKETEPEVEEVLLFPDGTWKGQAVQATRTPPSSPSPPRPPPVVPQVKPTKRVRSNGKAPGVGNELEGAPPPRKRQKRRKGLLPIGVLPVAGPALPPKRRRQERAAANGAQGRRVEALAQRRKAPSRPFVVKRVPVAQRRAAVIAAGPNKSVGVDSDASPEVVSDSEPEMAEADPKKKQCAKDAMRTPRWPHRAMVRL
eukprot:symbB.v1.2.036710.t1/scaffold5234.1/size29521/1